MSKILILGAGIAGHTAASHLRRKLSRDHEVLVVSPNRNYQWVPSNIWVDLPDAVLTDACSQLATFQAFWEENGLAKTLIGSMADFVGNDSTSYDTLGVMGSVLIPVGVTTFTYVTEDSCGNTGDCSFTLTVADMQPPVARGPGGRGKAGAQLPRSAEESLW